MLCHAGFGGKLSVSANEAVARFDLPAREGWLGRQAGRRRLEEVAAGNVTAVTRHFGCKRVDAKSAFEIIAALDPKPCSGFYCNHETQYIIPDIVIEKTNNGYEANVNKGNLPRLTISPYYRKLLTETERGSEVHLFLTERLNTAVALIKSVEQRGQTIKKITSAIIECQNEFLEKGKSHLKPMTMKQIANKVNLHESTVSRTVKGKYIQTPHGIVEMRWFFGSGVRTSDGEGASAESVQIRIAELIKSEDKTHLLSDQDIACLLEKCEVFISRRTVAKYREIAGIPSSTKRKRN